MRSGYFSFAKNVTFYNESKIVIFEGLPVYRLDMYVVSVGGSSSKHELLLDLYRQVRQLIRMAATR